MNTPFHCLVNDIGIRGSPRTADDGREEFWFRAAERFEVRASWPIDGNCVEFISLLGNSEKHASLAAPDADPGWCGDCSEEGHAKHLVAWHRPTASWLVTDRIPLSELDSVRFGEALGAFIDRLLAIDSLL